MRLESVKSNFNLKCCLKVTKVLINRSPVGKLSVLMTPQWIQMPRLHTLSNWVKNLMNFSMLANAVKNQSISHMINSKWLSKSYMATINQLHR